MCGQTGLWSSRQKIRQSSELQVIVRSQICKVFHLSYLFILFVSGCVSADGPDSSHPQMQLASHVSHPFGRCATKRMVVLD